MVASFGTLIREIRKRYRYRQEDLARAIGVDRTTVGDWETGRNNPSRSRLELLIRRFPSYTSQLYVAGRFLPLELDANGQSAKAFGQLVRELRRQCGYRQSDLAEAIDANHATISSWEKAKQTVSRLYVEDLAKCFPCDASRLYFAAGLIPLEVDVQREHQLHQALQDALQAGSEEEAPDRTSAIRDLL